MYGQIHATICGILYSDTVRKLISTSGHLKNNYQIYKLSGFRYISWTQGWWEQYKRKVDRRKELINIRAYVNEKENNEMHKISEMKSSVLLLYLSKLIFVIILWVSFIDPGISALPLPKYPPYTDSPLSLQ